MGRIYHSITELIGNTPLLEVEKIEREEQALGKVLVKLEYLNPAGSVKDRTALAMLEDARRSGKIKEGAVIIEPTSGNTGIGLAIACISYGYRLILTMPESMSLERRNILKAYGAELVLTEAKKGMQGAVDKAQELAKEIEGSFIPGQFVNQANVKVHYETTGPEIWEDTNGKVDVLVAGIGTGGTLTGAGSYLREKNPELEIIAVEPSDSPLLSEGRAGSHPVQGIGANFVPAILDQSLYNRVETVTGEQAFKGAKMLAKKEGVLVGISSGASFHVALTLAKQEAYRNKTIVVVLPDSGDRYYSTPLFQD